MEDKEFISRLEDIISTIKDGDREQAENDLADLYDEVTDKFEDDDWDDDEDFEEEDEDESEE